MQPTKRGRNFTSAIFHNLDAHDSHLFVNNLGKTQGNIKCIPNNEEKYISFSKDVVVDSFINKEGKEFDIKNELHFIEREYSQSNNTDRANALSAGGNCYIQFAEKGF